MVVINSDSPVAVRTKSESRVVIIGGENLGKRYMWWNFASSKLVRIEEAMARWKDGSMGMVPGEKEFAALPESDSFSAMKG